MECHGSIGSVRPSSSVDTATRRNKLSPTCKLLTLSHTSVVEPEQDADYAMMIVEHLDFDLQPSIPGHTTRDRVERQSAEMRYGLKFFATTQTSEVPHSMLSEFR